MKETIKIPVDLTWVGVANLRQGRIVTHYVNVRDRWEKSTPS